VQGFSDFIRRDIRQPFKHPLNAVKPDLGFLFNIGIGGAPAADAGVARPGADRPAAAPGGGAHTQITLVDQADVGQDLALLKTHQVLWAHVLELLPAALLANDAAGFEILRTGEGAHEELGCGRAARQVEIDLDKGVDRLALGQKVGQVVAVGLGHEHLAHFIPVAEVGHAAGDGAGAHGYHTLDNFSCLTQVEDVFIVANAAADQKNLRVFGDGMGGDHQGHVNQLVLLDPLAGVDQRDLAAGAAGELQDGEARQGWILGHFECDLSGLGAAYPHLSTGVDKKQWIGWMITLILLQSGVCVPAKIGLLPAWERIRYATIERQ
jgi:hypothetical protein